MDPWIQAGPEDKSAHLNTGPLTQEGTKDRTTKRAHGYKIQGPMYNKGLLIELHEGPMDRTTQRYCFIAYRVPVYHQHTKYYKIEENKHTFTLSLHHIDHTTVKHT